MARRLRRTAASILSAALVLCSLGLDAQRAAAQNLTVRTVPISPTPQLGAPGAGLSPAPIAPALATLAPTLSAPSLSGVAAAPVAAPLASPAAAAARVSASVAVAAPALQALAKPDASVSASAAAGRDLEAALTGAPAARAGSADLAVAGSLSASSTRLSAWSAASASSDKKDEVPAAGAPAGVDSESQYEDARVFLRAVAAGRGAVYTLPQAGPKLTERLIERAATRRVVLSDYDDTLAGYNEVLPQPMIDSIKAIRAAGKEFVVISDRGDEKRPGSAQLTVFESLESIPAADRAGMFVAANNGGRVYRYDAQGVPQKVYEVPSLEQDATKGDAVRGAAEATKARLAEAGVTQHVDDGKNPSESYNTYGYAMMIKAGATEAQVKHAGKIMEEELAKRGFNIEVNPRMPKDPANPPYITFSIIDKSYAARWIAGALGATKDEVLTIGDNYYKPREGTATPEEREAAEKLSGRALGVIGNETDRNMERGVPESLSLSVGGTADPRMRDGWVLAGKGPAVTKRVLDAVAAGPIGAPKKSEKGSAWETLGFVALIAALAAAGAAGWYMLYSSLAQIIQMGADALRSYPFNADEIFMGGALLGVAGMLGMGPSRLLTHPADSYATALKAVTDIAAQRGLPPEAVRFVEATATTPTRDGKQWNFTFALNGADGRTSLVYASFDNFLGGSQDFRTRVYEGAAASEGLAPVALSPVQFRAETGLGAEHALNRVNAAMREFGASASVRLSARPNGQGLFYTFYDDHGSVVSVDGLGIGAPKIEKVSEKAAKAEAAAAAKAAAKALAKAEKAAAKAGPVAVTHAGEPNELYELAVERIGETAAALGLGLDKVEFVSAVHQARQFNGAWIGDEWRFHFSVAGLPYMVPARRTMVTETMMDAFEPVQGSLPRFGSASRGLPVSAFSGLVTVAPEAVLKAAAETGRPVGRLTLIQRGASLVYSAQDMNGDEVLSMDAKTGETRAGDPAREPGSVLGGLLVGLALAAAVAAVYGLFAWAMMNAPAAPAPTLPDGSPIPVMPNGGWESLFGGFIGAGALFGMIRGGSRLVLTDPAELLPEAARIARKKAEEAGADPASVRFAAATAVTPAVEDRRWSFAFAFPAKNGGTSLLYVDASAPVAGSGVEWTTSLYPRGLTPEVETVDPALALTGLKVSAETAVQLLRRDHPVVGTRLSVSLGMDREAVSNDGDLWYRFYGEEGAEGRVNARTGQTRLVRAPSGERERENRELRSAMGWVGVASAGIAALFAALYALFV